LRYQYIASPVIYVFIHIYTVCVCVYIYIYIYVYIHNLNVCLCVVVRARAHARACLPFLNSNIMEKRFVICETGPKYSDIYPTRCNVTQFILS
jgi:hypothetical protein